MASHRIISSAKESQGAETSRQGLSIISDPFDPLIKLCNGDPALIQAHYIRHRNDRVEQQLSKFLSSTFTGLVTDPVLNRLSEPNYIDNRHGINFCARPPLKIRQLIAYIQKQLLNTAPNIWVVPETYLHLTVLEITHSRTAPEVATLLTQLSFKIAEITDYTLTHRARLLKPKLSFDASGVALSFVPAAGEYSHDGRTLEDDKYSYHHLRRDVYVLAASTGLPILSRYSIPSAHVTIGRFVMRGDLETQGQVDQEKVRRWVQKIKEINEWLEREHWPADTEGSRGSGEWIVGEERGLDCMMGTVWYGGGEAVRVGKGF